MLLCFMDIIDLLMQKLWNYILRSQCAAWLAGIGATAALPVSCERDWKRDVSFNQCLGCLFSGSLWVNYIHRCSQWLICKSSQPFGFYVWDQKAGEFVAFSTEFNKLWGGVQQASVFESQAASLCLEGKDDVSYPLSWVSCDRSLKS